MESISFPVLPEWDGCTVKEVVRRRLGFSAHTLVQLKQLPGGLRKNGSPVRSVDFLSTGDILTLTLPPEQTEVAPVALPLSILYEDAHFLVVDKPPHMPVHPSPGHDADSLCNAVSFYFRQTGQLRKIRPLYRLDRDTSGIVVIAKHLPASSAVLQKQYYAICQGKLSGSGTIDLPIGLTEESKIRRMCGVGERAVTHWRALQTDGLHTLLELSLETGRTHQIRAHLSHIGHPLAGDDLYGGSQELISRQALYCGKVQLACPALGGEKVFEIEMPNDMANLLRR